MPDVTAFPAPEWPPGARRHTGRSGAGHIIARRIERGNSIAGCLLYQPTQEWWPAYDLPIAVALLLASEQVVSDGEPQLFLGEFSLDGGLRHTNGILPMVSFAAESGYRRVFVPEADAPEASLVDGPEIYPVASLTQLVDHLRGDRLIQPYEMPADLELAEPPFTSDMAHVRGQEHVKRALEVAATGGHNAPDQWTIHSHPIRFSNGGPDPSVTTARTVAAGRRLPVCQPAQQPPPEHQPGLGITFLG